MVTVAVCPLLVAVSVAVPTATAVTSPLAETVATAVFDELHVTVAPLTVFPLASFNPAMSCCVCDAMSEALLGETVTVATAPDVGVMLCVAEVNPVAANVRV
jgi:hypothetical protein